MKRFLLPFLICPACLPHERPLDAQIASEDADELLRGALVCRHCRRSYPLRDGVAELLAEPAGLPREQSRYETAAMVERYLWSHYADLAGVAVTAAANAAWRAALVAGDGPGLDAGCAVGRLTFALAGLRSWAVGCDLSVPFVKAARRLARERRLDFSLPLEGVLREPFHIELPPEWRSDNLDFIVADAQRLPFVRDTFAQSASLNLLDRVTYPLVHLFELNRVARRNGADLLLASPFSWQNGPAAQELWLGGKETGEYRGRGVEVVRELLTGAGQVLTPPWRIERNGTVEWRMRSHCNHHELIASHYLCATR